MSNIESAKTLLNASGIFFDVDDDDDRMPPHTINLNDTFFWACSDCETVPDDELPQVAWLFSQYGWCGVLYWVVERRGWKAVEFVDVNRFIEFVRNEERIRREVPESSMRAYAEREYTIGSLENPK